MSEETVRDLQRRLARLERRERRLSALLAAAAALLLAGAVGRPAPEVARARAFEVTGTDGRTVAALRAGETGPELVLLDEEGVVRARLAHESEQTALMIGDASGTTRVGVAQFAHGGGGVALHGEQSRGAAVLYLAKGEGSLRFFDVEGDVTLRLPPSR